MMGRHVVAQADDVPPGTRKRFTVEGRFIALFNVDGEYFAALDRCPHRGGSFCEGRQTGLVESTEPGVYAYTRQGEIIRCPWHGWEFDLRTGRSKCAPKQWRARTFPVAIASGDSLGDGTLALEIFPVSVEHDYIVLTLPAVSKQNQV
jgi:nitrite reductase/ring-hydroxylating ferredoxin subunit